MTLQRDSDTDAESTGLPRRTFGVFLWYNSRDRDPVRRLAGHLKRAGLEPWFDRWSLTPGGEWQDEIIDGPPVPPVGAGEVAEITRRINQEVLFGRLSPADAAKQYTLEVEAAIGG